MAYWNAPQGKRDEEFVSPFRVEVPPGKRKYLTFQPDPVSAVLPSLRCSVEKQCIYHHTDQSTFTLAFSFYI